MYPKLFELGPVTIHTYGLLLAVAYLTAIALAAHLAERDGIPRNRSWDLGFIIVISSILGAKLLMVLGDLESYASEPSRLISAEFWQAGGVYYGGLLGAILGSFLYLWTTGAIPFWKAADAAAPAIALGQSVGRLGCLAAGCDYGRPTDVPWAITFTSEYAHRFVGVPLGTPLHPSQIYEALATSVLLFFLIILYRRRKFEGQVFCIYLVAYGIVRFLLEFYRGDLDRGFLFEGLLSTSQFISLLVIPAGIVAYGLLRGRPTTPRRTTKRRRD